MTNVHQAAGFGIVFFLVALALWAVVYLIMVGPSFNEANRKASEERQLRIDILRAQRDALLRGQADGETPSS